MTRRWARLALEPVELPRPWWRRHRYWLTTPAPFTGVDPIVVNMRTGTIHDWEFRGNRRGRGWFGVRTRWALVRPGWKRDPWVLLYSPARSRRPGSSARSAQAVRQVLGR